MRVGLTSEYGDSEWRGINAYDAPWQMPPGSVARADNLYVQSDRWYLRPGFVGQFAAALGFPVYSLTPVTQTDGTSHLWFACNGKLYKFIPDGAHTAPTQITYGGMPTLVTANVVITDGQGYVYVADGSSSPMMRFVADGTVGLGGAPYTGLAQPATLSPVNLGQLSLIGNPSALAWVSADTTTVANLISAANTNIRPDNLDFTGKYWTKSSPGSFDYEPWPTSGQGSYTTLTTASVVMTGVGSTYTVTVAAGATAGFVQAGYNVFVSNGAQIMQGYITAIASTTLTVISTAETGGTILSGHTVGLGSFRIFGGSGAYIQTAAPIPLTINSESLYPEVFEVIFTGQVKDTANRYPTRIKLTMFAYDGSSNLLAQQVLYIGLMSYTVWQDWACTFDFRGAGARKVSLRIEDANDAYVDADPIISNIRILPGGWGFSFPTPGGTNQDVLIGTSYASPVGNTCTGGPIATAAPATQGTALYTKSRRFYADLTALSAALKDWSARQRVVMTLDLVLQQIQAGATVPVRLFVQNTGGDRAYSEETFLVAGTNTPVSFDLTVVASSIKSDVEKFGVEFSDDIQTAAYLGYWAADPTHSPNFLYVQTITDPGNLTIDTSVSYVFVEWDSTTDPTALINIVQSNGSNPSATITPTITQSVASLTLPAKTNSTSNYYAIYRFGDFPDGMGRLLTVIPWATTTIAAPPGAPRQPSSGTIVAPANPYVSLASGIITDNTPSSWLFANAFESVYLDGRMQPPSYIREIVIWQNRLFVIAGQTTSLASGAVRQSTVWGSWLISEDQQAGLYFSSVVSLTDPNAEIKGFPQQPVGQQNNDIALRLLPLSSQMAIMMQRTPPLVMVGSGPLDWAIQDFPLGGAQSFGLVGRMAASLTSVPLNSRSALIQPTASVVYLNPNGVYAWDTVREPRQLSLNVRDLIAPQLGNGTAFKPVALALVVIWYHGAHFYAAMPNTSSDTTPTVIYRYEEPAGGITAIGGGQESGRWAKWYSANFNPTGGAMVPNSSDNAGHYIAGSDGQIYLCVPSVGDKALSGSSATGIPFSFTTRGYGYDQPFNVKTPSWLDIDFEYQTGEPDVALTVGVTARRGGFTQTYTLQEASPFSSTANNIDHMSLRCGFASGEVLQVTMTGTPTAAFIFGALKLTAVIGSGRRR